MRSIEDYIQEMEEDSRRWFDIEEGWDITTLVLGLAGETGEVCDLIKKWRRGSLTYQDIEANLQTELIDVFHYWCLLIGLLKIDVDEVYRAKREFNIARFE
jgi:NTP pyrophosphatase (non-canonical NTP hydrolase)